MSAPVGSVASVAVLDAYLAALRVRSGLPIAPCVACPGFARGGDALCLDCLRALDAAHATACGCEPCARAERVMRALTRMAGEGR